MTAHDRGRMAIATGLALLLGACIEDTGPAFSMSLDDVGVLAQELAGVFVPPTGVVFSRPAGASRSVAEGLWRAARAAVPFDQGGICSGGSAEAWGNFDTTATPMSASATAYFGSCATAHYRTTGTLRALGTYTLTATQDSVYLWMNGSLTVTRQDGISGACAVDVTLSAVGVGGSAPVYVATGTACGQRLPGK